MTDLTSVNNKIKRVWTDWRIVDAIGNGTYGEIYSAVLEGDQSCEAAVKVITVPKNEADALNVDDTQAFARITEEYTAIAKAVESELERMSLMKNVPSAACPEEYAVVRSENGLGYDILIRMEKLMPISGRFTEKEAVKLAIDICMALEAAEKAGIVHGNIKPSNIFSTDVGTYKLGDFGLASVLGAAVSDKTVYIDTPKYAAPELAGDTGADCRSDIYSLGKVLYELLPEAVSPCLADVLKKACAENPGERYTSAAELKQALVNVYTALMFGRAGGNAPDPMITEVFDISDSGDTDYAYEKQLEASAAVQSHFEDDFELNEYSAAFEEAYDAEDAFEPVKPKKTEKKVSVATIVLLIILALLLALIIVFGAVTLVKIFTPVPGDEVTEETEVLSQLAYLTVDVLPEKLEYRLEEPIDLDGLVLYAHYDDGTYIELTDGFTFSPKLAEYAGTNEITLMYGDLFVTFDVEVSGAALSVLTVVEPPEKSVFSVGEEYDFTGLVLEAAYSDGQTALITDNFSIVPAVADELGERTVKVSYGSKSVSIPVTVTESNIKALVIKSLPSRLNYFLGEKLDTSGMRLNVTRANGEIVTIGTGFTVSPSIFTDRGTQEVTITYGDKTVSFNVQVEGAVVNNIAIASMPEKTSYFVGESLITDGLAVKEVYTDGTTKRITSGFTVSPTVLSSEGKQKITVRYNGMKTTFSVSVSGVAISSVAVKTNPLKLDYVEGDTIDLTGLTLSAVYSNGVSETVSVENVTVSPTVLTTAGFTPITVNYSGLTAIFYVNVTEPIAVSGICDGTVSWELKRGTLTVSGTGEIGNYGYMNTPFSDYAGSITSVVVENGIISVGDYAFSGLSMQKITLPDTLKNVSATAFYGCTSLAEISVSSANRQLKSSGGILYSKDMTKLLAYPAAKSDTSYETPSTVTTVGGYEIFRGTALREIILGESVYSISPNAFSGASKLEKISVRSRNSILVSVDNVLFTKNMNELICYPAAKSETAYTIPNTVKYIRDYAFKDCVSLKSLVLPASIKRMGDYAFSGCKALSEVSYPLAEKDFTGIAVGSGNESLTNNVKFN